MENVVRRWHRLRLNKISDAGVVAISEALKTKTTLSECECAL